MVNRFVKVSLADATIKVAIDPTKVTFMKAITPEMTEVHFIGSESARIEISLGDAMQLFSNPIPEIAG